MPKNKGYGAGKSAVKKPKGAKKGVKKGNK